MLTISMGTPDRDAKVAECRRRSCDLNIYLLKVTEMYTPFFKIDTVVMRVVLHSPEWRDCFPGEMSSCLLYCSVRQCRSRCFDGRAGGEN